MTYKVSIVILLMIFIALPVIGQLRLKNDLNPDETVDHTFNKRFSLENSLRRIKQVREALASFCKLTEKSRGKLSEEEMSAIGNTDGERQNMGFHNWVGAIEGTLRKQDYQIKKLELELAREKYKSGRLEEKELKQKEACYKKAEAEFQKFWDSFVIVD